MKKIFLYTTALSLLLVTFSCSNEFLNDNIEQEEVFSDDSEIIISPDWDMDDYQFTCANAGNAEFTVKSAPKWLEVETTTGKLTKIKYDYIVMHQQSVGTIRCKAKRNSEFEKTGIYLDKIEISVNGNICYVPVAYISEGNPKIEVNPTLIISYNDYNSYLNIRNTGEGILLWDILSMPEWLTVNMNNMNNLNLNGIFIPQGGSYQLPLTFTNSTSLTGDQTGNIILKTNDKSNPQVTVKVNADFGTPQLYFYSYSTTIDFGKTGTSESVYFSNHGNGILTWNLSNLPEWLSVSKLSGGLYPYNSENVTFTCNRSLIPEGVSTITVYLNSNDAANSKIAITVKIRNSTTNPANVIGIDGNLIDAWFDKNTDILYYATSQPNKLLAYNTKTRNIAHEIALSKAPTCFAVSEDAAKAAVGHGGLISAINLTSFEVTKTIELSHSVYDIAWTNDDWFCYTQSGSSFSSLHWINTHTLESYNSPDSYNLDESSSVKKVPTQPFVIASRHATSPSGFITYSIATKTLKSYSHMDLTDYWFTEDGNYTFSRSGNVYKTSSATGSSDTFDADINYIGRLKSNSTNYYYPIWMDHSAATHNIWAIAWVNYYDDYPNIFQFEDNDYSLMNVYGYTDYYIKNGTDYSVQAHYVFANGAGTELCVIRKATNIDVWSLEFIQVTN